MARKMLNLRMSRLPMSQAKLNQHLWRQIQTLSNIINGLASIKKLQDREQKDQVKKCCDQIQNLIDVRGNLKQLIIGANCQIHRFSCKKEKLQKKKGISRSFAGIPIKMLKVELSQFPRYEYALDNMIDVEMRYKTVLQQSFIKLKAEKYISFYLCTTKDRMIDAFLQEAFENGQIISMTDAGSLEQFVQSKLLSSVSCFVLPETKENLLTEIGNILTETDRETRAFSKSLFIHPNKSSFCLPTYNAWKQIDRFLEKCLFQKFNPLYLELAREIESICLSRSAPERDSYEGRAKTDKCKYMSFPFEKDDNHKLMKLKSTEYKVRQDDEEANVSKDIYVRRGMFSTLREDIKICLMEEFIGLFNMSDVSIEDIPDIRVNRCNMDLKEISRYLFSKVEGLHGVGYRMQKLQVVVKDGQMFDTEEKQSKLHQALNDLNVYDYEIVPMSMNEFLTSGDIIDVDGKRGSFGCFAKTQETEGKIMICGLFSKHVASINQQETGQQETELRLIEDGEHKSVGKVISKTVLESGLDIAAAELSITEDECDTRFKTASGLPRKSVILDHIRSNDLRGRKVHMWGARSKPGRGIITVPEYICKGMEYTLIQVEDISDGDGTVEKRFAQPGDSGAIACTDVPGQDFVNLVSMIMGCMNYNEVEEDEKRKIKKKKGKYLTVPLPSGLEQISELIGKKVELF